MTYPWQKPQFYINANWLGRQEDATATAGRLMGHLNMLAAADRALASWSVGDTRKVLYGPGRPDLTSVISDDAVRSEDDDLIEGAGHGILCSSQEPKQPYSLIGTAGSKYPPPTGNSLMFRTNGNDAADPIIVTYRLMKAVMLATIDCWEPDFCIARSNQLDPDYKNEGRYTKAWMTYVPPAHVGDVDPVGVPFLERTPDGGLLLSATQEIFRPENPAHLEGATRISQALQPLNAVRAKT